MSILQNFQAFFHDIVRNRYIYEVYYQSNDGSWNSLTLFNWGMFPIMFGNESVTNLQHYPATNKVIFEFGQNQQGKGTIFFHKNKNEFTGDFFNRFDSSVRQIRGCKHEVSRGQACPGNGRSMRWGAPSLPGNELKGFRQSFSPAYSVAGMERTPSSPDEINSNRKYLDEIDDITSWVDRENSITYWNMDEKADEAQLFAEKYYIDNLKATLKKLWDEDDPDYAYSTDGVGVKPPEVDTSDWLESFGMEPANPTLAYGEPRKGGDPKKNQNVYYAPPGGGTPETRTDLCNRVREIRDNFARDHYNKAAQLFLAQGLAADSNLLDTTRTWDMCKVNFQFSELQEAEVFDSMFNKLYRIAYLYSGSSLQGDAAGYNLRKFLPANNADVKDRVEPRNTSRDWGELYFDYCLSTEKIQDFVNRMKILPGESIQDPLNPMAEIMEKTAKLEILLTNRVEGVSAQELQTRMEAALLQAQARNVQTSFFTRDDGPNWNATLAMDFMSETLEQLKNIDTTDISEQYPEQNAREIVEQIEAWCRLHGGVRQVAKVIYDTLISGDLSEKALLNEMVVEAVEHALDASPMNSPQSDTYPCSAVGNLRHPQTDNPMYSTAPARDAWGEGGGVAQVVLYAFALTKYTMEVNDSKNNLVSDIGFTNNTIYSGVTVLEAFLAKPFSKWLSKAPNTALPPRLTTMATRFASWLDEGASGSSSALRIFGNSANQFAARVAVVTGVVALGLSCYQLYDAVKAGSAKDIVMASVNTALSAAGIVAGIAAIASFAWAGPLAFGVAVVGAIVAIIDLLIYLYWPQPPSALERFDEAFMKREGYRHKLFSISFTARDNELRLFQDNTKEMKTGELGRPASKPNLIQVEGSLQNLNRRFECYSGSQPYNVHLRSIPGEGLEPGKFKVSYTDLDYLVDNRGRSIPLDIILDITATRMPPPSQGSEPGELVKIILIKESDGNYFCHFFDNVVCSTSIMLDPFPSSFKPNFSGIAAAGMDSQILYLAYHDQDSETYWIYRGTFDKDFKSNGKINFQRKMVIPGAIEDIKAIRCEKTDARLNVDILFILTQNTLYKINISKDNYTPQEGHAFCEPGYRVVAQRKDRNFDSMVICNESGSYLNEDFRKLIYVSNSEIGANLAENQKQKYITAYADYRIWERVYSQDYSYKQSESHFLQGMDIAYGTEGTILYSHASATMYDSGEYDEQNYSGIE
ncbi:hypothetical protein SCOR_27820 [Sulfidibacter corallicola]|uniref:Uncharacterized protein n=1 Tax=Sulfidibacter corallicola TaxID=2818388 RepID=A0A8A4TVS9_SULCO|nr:hypothetical protein [Sulfidibacter corallicola]QTD50635.1 hypothetical protein J3U87_34045 [Sulfidibacter corallicola]